MMAGKNYGSAKLDPSWTRKEKKKKKQAKVWTLHLFRSKESSLLNLQWSLCFSFTFHFTHAASDPLTPVQEKQRYILLKNIKSAYVLLLTSPSCAGLMLDGWVERRSLKLTEL